MFYMHVHCILIKKIFTKLTFTPFGFTTFIYMYISRWGFMEFILYSYVLTAVKFTILFAESATNIDVPHSHWFLFIRWEEITKEKTMTFNVHQLRNSNELMSTRQQSYRIEYWFKRPCDLFKIVKIVPVHFVINI